MAERKKVGILFNYSEGWIGGTYYFINLVNALTYLEDNQKPEVIIVTDDIDSFNKIRETGYPYLSRLKARYTYSFLERILNKLSRSLSGGNIIMKGADEKELPVLFGYYEQLPFYKCKRKIYWIPDLQDCYYPQYIGAENAMMRKKQHLKLAYSKKEIVFSSESAKQDFEKFYPDSLCFKYVMPFAVSVPSLNESNIKALLHKYDLPDKYIIAPNQFWPHKNHITVIKAIELLKQKNQEYTIVFTGNENTGDGKYAKELKGYVQHKGINKLVHFLGFIDREEQLLLMKKSIAVIQASLFEGWSTVIEDAKALGKFLIASDIPVHHEQLKKEAVFFKPNDVEQLADVITQLNPTLNHSDYKKNVLGFAKCFSHIININS